jgi:hypothetical protein
LTILRRDWELPVRRVRTEADTPTINWLLIILVVIVIAGAAGGGGNHMLRIKSRDRPHQVQVEIVGHNTGVSFHIYSKGPAFAPPINKLGKVKLNGKFLKVYNYYPERATSVDNPSTITVDIIHDEGYPPWDPDDKHPASASCSIVRLDLDPTTVRYLPPPALKYLDQVGVHLTSAESTTKGQKPPDPAQRKISTNLWTTCKLPILPVP